LLARFPEGLSAMLLPGAVIRPTPRTTT